MAELPGFWGLFGIAIARADESGRIATLNLNVGYPNPTSERVLRCEARVLSLRRTVAIVEGEITDESGTLVAKAVGTFAVRRG